jgi:hypothetical protein
MQGGNRVDNEMELIEAKPLVRQYDRGTGDDGPVSLPHPKLLVQHHRRRCIYEDLSRGPPPRLPSLPIRAWLTFTNYSTRQ